jgi:hypothetical protein
LAYWLQKDLERPDRRASQRSGQKKFIGRYVVVRGLRCCNSGSATAAHRLDNRNVPLTVDRNQDGRELVYPDVLVGNDNYQWYCGRRRRSVIEDNSS